MVQSRVCQVTKVSFELWTVLIVNGIELSLNSPFNFQLLDIDLL